MITSAPTLEYTLFIPQDTPTAPFVLDQASGRFVLSEEGNGMPPIEYITERGPFQDGETIRGYFLRPRILTLHIRNNFCSRDKYWEGRSDLLNAIRPNRGTAGVLRRILSNGKTRDLTCTIQTGPNFNPRQDNRWDEWAFDEVLRFVANDPIYYDPAVQTTTWVHPTCGSFPYTFPIFLNCPLSFPITFPIVFYDFGGNQAININYQGNWKEYPSIVITGPSSTMKINNLTTGETIVLNYNLLAGETATIDLTYGSKTVTKNDGTDLIAYVSNDSDLATFHLEPGINQLEIQGFGAGANTTVVMSYHHRFIGLGG